MLWTNKSTKNRQKSSNQMPCDSRAVFTPAPTPSSCSSTSDTHRSMGFLRNQTFDLVEHSPRPIDYSVSDNRKSQETTPMTVKKRPEWQTTSDQFHFRLPSFSSHLKSKVVNILTKTVTLRITLNIDGTPITSKSHTHPSNMSNLQSVM